MPPSVVLGNKVVGDIVELQAVTSASKSADVLRDATFLGIGGKAASQNNGGRVVFQYAALSAVEISRFSALGDVAAGLAHASDSFVNEEEVLLLPGARFKIDSITSWEYGVVEVQLHQLPPATRRNVHADGGAAGAAGAAGSSLADPLGTYSAAAPLYENIDTYLAPDGRAATATLPPYIYDEGQGTVLSMNPASYGNTQADAQSPVYAVCAEDARDVTLRPANGAAPAANRSSVYDVASVAGYDVDVLVAGGGAALYSIPLDTGNDFATYDRVRGSTIRVRGSPAAPAGDGRSAAGSAVVLTAGASGGSSIYSVPLEQGVVTSEA